LYSFFRDLTVSLTYAFSYFSYVVLLNYLSLDKIFYLPVKALLRPPKILELEEKLNPDNQVF